MVEYAGPIAITLLLILFRKKIYGSDTPFTFNQKLGIGMVLFHYIKREIETIFVHRFGNDTMPWTNILKNSLHYWGIFGICCMYFFLKPDYKPPSWANKTVFIALGALFTVFEALNLQTHLILRNLRK